MELSPMAEPQVTIVVVPRERFSFTSKSLESIYEHTKVPFKLVYVDGGSPVYIRRYLEAQAQAKEFQLIRTDYYLAPNKARNLGLRQVSSKYVVFIDNDVVVAPGWLSQLVHCAEETGATIVTPLTCEGEPLHQKVHCAGGEARILQTTKGGKVERYILAKLHKRGRRVADIRNQLQRQQTELAEFHCMMVRTKIFEQVGMLDEAVLNTREHADFCMTVAQAGGTVYLEMASVVTYVPGVQLQWSDIRFYMLRWSDAWGLSSLERLRDKWNLTRDEYGRDYLGWRRKIAIIDPLVRNLTFGRYSKQLANFLLGIDKVLNRYITNRYAHSQRKQDQVIKQLHQSPKTSSLPS